MCVCVVCCGVCVVRVYVGCGVCVVLWYVHTDGEVWVQYQMQAVAGDTEERINYRILGSPKRTGKQGSLLRSCMMPQPCGLSCSTSDHRAQGVWDCSNCGLKKQVLSEAVDILWLGSFLMVTGMAVSMCVESTWLVQSPTVCHCHKHLWYAQRWSYVTPWGTWKGRNLPKITSKQFLRPEVALNPLEVSLVTNTRGQAETGEQIPRKWLRCNLSGCR